MSGTRPGQSARRHMVVPTLLSLTLFAQCVYIGGNIASSWAVLKCMGEDGYMEIAERLMEVATRMKDGINSIEVYILWDNTNLGAGINCLSVCYIMQGMFVCGTPHMTLLAFSSSDTKLNIFAVADLMEEKGFVKIIIIRFSKTL